MPWDLIFYGSMAIIFIGIMAASARARREQKASPPGDGNTDGTKGPRGDNAGRGEGHG